MNEPARPHRPASRADAAHRSPDLDRYEDDGGPAPDDPRHRRPDTAPAAAIAAPHDPHWPISRALDALIVTFLVFVVAAYVLRTVL